MERRLFEPEHDMFRDSVRRFFQKEVEPHRDRWHEQGQVDREIYRKGGEQGLLLMQVGEEYGGAGIRDFRYEQILLEENLRYGDSGLYFTLHSRLVAPYIEGLGTEEQKRRFLPRLRQRRDDPRHRHDRAGRRQRPGRHEDPCGGPGRPLPPERRQDLHLQRHQRRPLRGGRAHGAAWRAAASWACSWWSAACPASPAAAT